MKRIDPHVHDYSGLASVLKLAEQQGIGAVLVMPRVNQPILREKDLLKKLAESDKIKSQVKRFFYISLTSNKNQIEEAVKLVRDYPEVVGLKLFPPENEKKKIFKDLARLGYEGVLAVHAEKASLFRPYLFDPKRPWTHNLARPLSAELESIKELIGFATETNFQGTLYICHITSLESAKIIWQNKKHLDIYSEVTPHHLLFSDLQMRGEGGILLKVNPPLRDCRAAKALLGAARQGLIDCLGTDYAFHPKEKKISLPYSSGIACYELYGLALDLVGQGLNEKEIEKMTYWNIKKVFKDKLREV